MPEDTVIIRRVDPDSEGARAALASYYRELAETFPEGFEVERSLDPEHGNLIPLKGAFLLATVDGTPVGCVALKGDGSQLAEIKRMWVRPDHRGTGLARRLMAAAEEEARRLGITNLRLDTHRTLKKAASSYRAWGWREIERFNDDPYAHLFFEKDL